MKLRIRVSVRRPAARETAPFRGIAKGRVPRICALAGSIALHVSMVALVAFASREMSIWLKDDDLDWSRYRAEPLRLHLLQPLYLQAGASGDRPKPPASVTRPKTAARATLAGGLRTPHVPSRLELPAAREVAKNAPVILQPDYRPQTSPPPELPPLPFWARQPLSLRNRPAKEIVVPGRADEARTMPDLAAPPVLEVPNSEALAGDLNISLPKILTSSQRALPAPNSATQPVRLRGETGSHAASFEQFAGQATNVLAIAAPKPNLTDVQIPHGLQNVPSTQDRGAASGEIPEQDEAAKSSTLAKTDGAPNELKGGGENTNQRSLSRDRNKIETHASQSVRPQTGASAKSGPKAPAGVEYGSSAGRAVPATTQSVAPTNATQSQHHSPVTTITHPPKGKFDVVIMQTPSSAEDLGDLGSGLMGNPVYTVYLQVGDKREWLLEYCLPSHRAAPASTYQVDVNDTAPVTPPYPVSTAIPTDLIRQSIPNQIVIHGFLTAAGNLQRLDTPDDKSQLAHQLLSLLGGWQFRPAQRNMEPIEIEVLLVVPARS